MIDSIGACVSDLRIDRWLTDELNAAETRAFEAHTARCSTCAARAEAVVKHRDEFAHAPTPAALSAAFAQAKANSVDAGLQPSAGGPRAAGSRPALSVHRGGRADAPEKPPAASSSRGASAHRRRPLLAALPMLAAAAAALVWLRAPTLPSANDTVGGERSKGNAHLIAYVVRDDAAHLAAPGEIVHPDDILQLAYSTTEPVYLAVLSRDGAGVVSVYFDDAGHAAAVAPGRELSLPYSITLDQTLGPETLYALFCASPVELSALRQRLAAATDPTSLTAPAGCQLDTLALDKRSP